MDSLLIQTADNSFSLVTLLKIHKVICPRDYWILLSVFAIMPASRHGVTDLSHMAADS